MKAGREGKSAEDVAAAFAAVEKAGHSGYGKLVKLDKAADLAKRGERDRAVAAYDAFAACMASLPGKIALFGFSACLVYHFLNGIRHLFWDAGYGFEIKDAYRSGWIVVAVSAIATAVSWIVGLRLV